METKTTVEVVVRVTRPDLTPEERARRMAEIKKAATGLIVAAMKAKAAPAVN